MKIISIFNNKGGVGKTTLTYHLAHILAEMGKKVLILDMDSQCNMSLYGMQEQELEKIWRDENSVIDNGFDSAKKQMDGKDFENLFKTTRTMHFLLKSVEEGVSDFDELPPPIKLTNNLDLIPSRLTLFKYENKIADRWSGMFLGEPLSIRTVTRIRKLAELYSEKNHYDFVIIDTSPSLGMLNKIIISTVDGLMIPCLPDMFSLYGIKNIGEALKQWQREFNTCFQIISGENRKRFPKNPVQFLGYTIYNAKKYESKNRWNLAQAHLNYAEKIPETIKIHIDKEVRKHLSEEMVETPIWKVPTFNGLEPKDKSTISGNSASYKATQKKYKQFADDFLTRVATLDDE
ncbi:ParA family protein [Candidatus Marithrix sp. Canyon 246]|uniref:ParA family protein n=1 Tax=Candidatus Marithrix sp. Canyon 246 TaxID=1827136 RepID=UPI00084A2B0F|nr:AAA family ATPase [Candidatus Marithrix sp. Canyon 246]